MDNHPKFAPLESSELGYQLEAITFSEVLIEYETYETENQKNIDYWLNRARFYAIGIVNEFKNEKSEIPELNIILETYSNWMSYAIDLCEINALKLKIEKEKTIGELKNLFESELREENLEKIRAIQEQQRQDQALVDGENHAQEIEQKLKKKKIQLLIIGSSIFVIVLILLFSLSRCSSTTETDLQTVNVEKYDNFLILDNLLYFFEQDVTRDEIMNLDFDFSGPGNNNLQLRTHAPDEARFNRLTFHFAEDGEIYSVLIEGATYFNGFYATEELTADLLSGHDEFEFEIFDGFLTATSEKLFILITNHNDDTFSISIQLFAEVQDELNHSQQEVWDLIEERINVGFTFWHELLGWAIENEINFDFSENGVLILQPILQLVMQYGLVGEFIEAYPHVGSRQNHEQVILILNFREISYNSLIAELFSLNPNSNRELTTWLDSSGYTRLTQEFNTVEIIDIDETKTVIYEMPEIVEFIKWEISTIDLFAPIGSGTIRIFRHFEIIEIEEEEDDEEDDDDEDDILEALPTTLSSGTWIVGEDVGQGRFMISGNQNGTLSIWRGDDLLVNEVLGGGEFGILHYTTYLLQGDVIEISNISAVSFIPVTNRVPTNNISSGTWIVGVDLLAGTFDVRVPFGFGSFIIWRGTNVITNELIGDGSVEAGVEHIRVTLQNGDIVLISGIDRVYFE